MLFKDALGFQDDGVSYGPPGWIHQVILLLEPLEQRWYHPSYHKWQVADRREHTAGEQSVSWEPLINYGKKEMSPLSSTVDLRRWLIITLDQYSDWFSFASDLFQRLMAALVCVQVFHEHAIRQIIKSSRSPSYRGRKEGLLEGAFSDAREISWESQRWKLRGGLCGACPKLPANGILNVS